MSVRTVGSAVLQTGPQGPAGATGPTGPTGPSFTVTSPTVTALTAGEKNGTAFQPRANGPSLVNVTASLSGVLNVMTSVTVALSPTLNGTYVPVSLFALTVNVAGVGVADNASGSVLVPTGHYLKVTQTGVSILANVAMTRVVWSL